MEPFPPRYTIATTQTWLRLYGGDGTHWTWADVAQRFNTPFNTVLLQSPLYPNETRVVGSGRIDYDPEVSDYTIRLPVAAYYVEMESIIQRA